MPLSTLAMVSTENAFVAVYSDDMDRKSNVERNAMG